ncbi:MAG: succinate dehydrogenase [Parasporobacterium sp.]|nr:succinate dehydrogenase [Parasporobacterium sp.]
MKIILKIILAPLVALFTVFCWIAMLAVRISGTVLGLAAMILGALGLAVLLLVSVKNGLVVLAMAFLICPYGLPLLAAMLVGQLQRFRCWMLDTIYG